MNERKGCEFYREGGSLHWRIGCDCFVCITGGKSFSDFLLRVLLDSYIHKLFELFSHLHSSLRRFSSELYLLRLLVWFDAETRIWIWTCERAVIRSFSWFAWLEPLVGVIIVGMTWPCLLCISWRFVQSQNAMSSRSLGNFTPLATALT